MGTKPGTFVFHSDFEPHWMLQDPQEDLVFWIWIPVRKHYPEGNMEFLSVGEFDHTAEGRHVRGGGALVSHVIDRPRHKARDNVKKNGDISTKAEFLWHKLFGNTNEKMLLFS